MTEAPKRIQRLRAKGWKIPAGAVCVTRPSIFGNPFPTDVYGTIGAVDKFRRLMTTGMSASEMSESSTSMAYYPLVFYRSVLKGRLHELRGKDLACWCALDSCCHADVLLELANPVPSPEGEG